MYCYWEPGFSLLEEGVQIRSRAKARMNSGVGQELETFRGIHDA